jgi:hypothetical protein
MTSWHIQLHRSTLPVVRTRPYVAEGSADSFHADLTSG